MTDQTFDEANAFLMGSGARTASLKQHGDRVWGTIMSAEKRQQTDFDSGQPLFWEDGKPRMQVAVTLLTELHEDDDDDGLRTVYIKGEMQKAVRAAFAKAGVRGMEDGGKLLIEYTGDGEPKRRGMSGAKLYYAKYEPPTKMTELPDQSDDEGPAEPF